MNYRPTTIEEERLASLERIKLLYDKWLAKPTYDKPQATIK
jgi:hypothetical protein